MGLIFPLESLQTQAKELFLISQQILAPVFCLFSSISVYLPPKWLTNALSLLSLWFYEQNLSRYTTFKKLFTLPQTYCLGMENMLNRQQIYSVFTFLFFFEKGRCVLCNFVSRKTNIRVHGGRKLSNFHDKAQL